MMTIEFSEADVKALHAERFLHPHPRVQVRLEAVYLKSQHLSHQDELDTLLTLKFQTFEKAQVVPL
jgi:hypothetical protein